MADKKSTGREKITSLRPNSEGFRHFMTQGWAPEKMDVKPLASSRYTPARLEKLSARFPGERLIIPAGRAKVRNSDCNYMFRPDSTFAYYTGLGEDYEDGAVLVLEPAGRGHKPILFVHQRFDNSTPEFFRDPHYGEYWVGARPGVDEFHVMTGLETRRIGELTSFIARNVTSERGGTPLRVVREADPALTRLVEGIREQGGFTDVKANIAKDEELHRFGDLARMVKDGYEVSQIRDAIRATRHGFDNILRHLDSSVGVPRGERILEGAFNSVARVEGNGLGYDTIIASGADAPTLHWMRNTHEVHRGDLVLIDAGVESDGLYSADVTRTFPVDGKFTPTQLKVYNAVFKAQKAGFDAVKVGGTYWDIHFACMRSLAQDLHEWGILKVPVEEALSPEGQEHRRWHACGVSHHLGIDVHDCNLAPFEKYQGGTFTPGMVFTIEPGLYFRKNDLMVPPEMRGIGVRIEDDVLVTDKGPVWLSKPFVPSAPADVEAWIAEERKHPVADTVPPKDEK